MAPSDHKITSDNVGSGGMEGLPIASRETEGRNSASVPRVRITKLHYYYKHFVLSIG